MEFRFQQNLTTAISVESGCAYHLILFNVFNTILWIYTILKMLVQYDTVSELTVSDL